MTTYRAYRVDDHRRIKSAEWLDAPNDNAAVEQAEELCEEGAPTIEVWQSTRLVDAIECDED
ncbi:MAG TPA: hypothetical protein VGH86_01495 [Phenylobacterium sp.]|jgi:hypothetical protein